MKAFAAYVGAAALVLVAVMVAAPTSLAAEAQAPQAAVTPQQQTQVPPASPATGHAMQMMNRSAAGQPAMGQMTGQGQMMGHGRMMGSDVNVDELVNAVKSATGDAKIDALADLIVGLFSRSQGMMSTGGMGGGMGTDGMMMGGAMSNGRMYGATGGMRAAPVTRSPQPNR